MMAVASARPSRLTLVERLDAYERLMRLDKPIGTLLLLWPTLSAMWLAAGGSPRFSLVLIFCVGTLVMRSAGCAMNDWADRDFDPHVARTAQRPLAARIIAPWEALAVAGMAVIGRVHALGVAYYGALAVAGVIAIAHVRMIRSRDPAACFRAFLGNHWLGMTVFLGVALDYAIRAGRWPHGW